MWGLIAFGLLVVFIFVGYQAALKHHPTSAPVVDASSLSPTMEAQPGPADGTQTTAPSAPLSVAPDVSSPPLTHQLLQSAAANHQHEMVIQYGQQLVASDTAGPDDLLAIAESYGAVNDCANARVWGEK